MEEFLKCEDLGYKFIKELLEFIRQKKSIEEVMHFVNIGFEYTFGASAIFFLHRSYNGEERVVISRGFSNEFIKKINVDPPLNLIDEIMALKKGLYIDFRKDNEKYAKYNSLFEHNNVSEFYAYELKTAYTDSYSVVIYAVDGFKNCGGNKIEVFDTIFSIIAFIVNSNKCIQTMRDCSQIDYVSGLNNFKYFHEKLFQEMQKALNEKGILSVSLISINQLNKLNSMHGHYAGDKCIGIIANIVKKNIRAFDTASRYGNKFIILFPNIDKNAVRDILKKIFFETEDSLKKEYEGILSLNAGISTFPEDGSNERTILDISEGRRTEAKRKDKWTYL